MTHRVKLFQIFPLNNDELCRFFEDDVVHFENFKNEYFNQSTQYDKYYQVNDAFRHVQIVPACEYYNLQDMNKARTRSCISINMSSFNICSVSRHLEHFLAEINSLTFGVMKIFKTR